MSETEVIEICTEVLASLTIMDFEKGGGNSEEQLIFPVKIQSNGTKKKDRISEQELRQVFIDKFKNKKYPQLYYSIETPTETKFKFGKTYNEFLKNIEVRKVSASLDMCIFKKENSIYKRILNIEFKHSTSLLGIAKDVLKLMREKQNGAFIFLLKNTNSGSLSNSGKGVIDKLSNIFTMLKENWNREDKYIQLIILSLEHKTKKNGSPFLLHRTIRLGELDSSFSMSNIKDRPITKQPSQDEWGKWLVENG